MGEVWKNNQPLRFPATKQLLRHKRRPQSVSSKKEKKMATWSDDDGFSIFSSDDEKTKSTNDQEKAEQLDQSIKQVMQQKRQEIEGRRQEAFATVRLICERLLGTANNVHSLFRKYIRTTKDGRVDILDFRALDTDVFQCVVPLKRPVRSNTFMFRHKQPREYPSHRMLLCLNDEIPKVDRIQIQHEWGHCVDTSYILRPDFVLRWFNKGLRVTVDVMQCAKAENSSQSNKCFDLTSKKTEDGTIWIHVNNCTLNGTKRNYMINFIPCIPLRDIPKQIKLAIPIPNRRPHLQKITNFKREIILDVGKGGELFFLEARLFKWSIATKFEPSIAVSWHLGTTKLEDRAYKTITMLTNSTHFENIILLLGHLKNQNVTCLRTLSNRMILNAILHTHRKCMGQLHKSEEWFMAVLEFIQIQLESGCAPAFFLNKLNLLSGWDKQLLDSSGKGLKALIKDLKKNPEILYSLTGYDEKKESDKESDDGDNDEQNRSFEEGAQFEDSEHVTDSGRRGSDDNSEKFENVSEKCSSPSENGSDKSGYKRYENKDYKADSDGEMKHDDEENDNSRSIEGDYEGDYKSNEEDNYRSEDENDYCKEEKYYSSDDGRNVGDEGSGQYERNYSSKMSAEGYRSDDEEGNNTGVDSDRNYRGSEDEDNYGSDSDLSTKGTKGRG